MFAPKSVRYFCCTTASLHHEHIIIKQLLKDVLSFNISIDEHLILIAYVKLHIDCPPDIHTTYAAY